MTKERWGWWASEDQGKGSREAPKTMREQGKWWEGRTGLRGRGEETQGH